MMKFVTVLAAAGALMVGVTLSISSAFAGNDPTYHWAYPDAFKVKPDVHAVAGGSGLPADYR